MPKQRISENEAKLWQDIAHKLQQASDAVQQAHVDLLVQLECQHPKALERITEAENALSGLAYLFTPQPEWTGGDSSDPKNFKMNTPHIVESDPRPMIH